MHEALARAERAPDAAEVRRRVELVLEAKEVPLKRQGMRNMWKNHGKIIRKSYNNKDNHGKSHFFHDDK